jgi:hypothetical protein
MDQTPAPFEYLDGRTYNAKGDKTIWVKAEKSGWDKRQATVQLTVLGDGTMSTPWIYLKGEGNVTEEEKQRYDKRVEVRFNPKAYANEGTVLEWIEDQLAPQFDGRRALVALDAAAFHRTPAVLDLLRKKNVVPSMIPSGCTSLVPVLDVYVNRVFKDYLKQSMDEQLLNLALEYGEDKALKMLGGPDLPEADCS